MTDEQRTDGTQELLAQVTRELVDEKRRSRRWGIFFRSAFLLWLVAVLVAWHSGGRDIDLGEHVGLVELNGELAPDGEATADNVIAGLRAAYKRKNTLGVILRLNSPGGSPVQAGYIYDEIVRLRGLHPKQPLYAVIGDVCASGCYYAAAAADRIYADKGSIVGSIGVLMDGFGFVDTLGKLGIERRLMTAGRYKGLLDPFSPLEPRAVAHTQKMLDRIHQQFISRVKEGRGDRLKDNGELFSGLFWTGERALELGLVDGLGSASYVAREVIGNEEIVDYTPKEDLIKRLSGGIGVAIARAIGIQARTPAPNLR